MERLNNSELNTLIGICIMEGNKLDDLSYQVSDPNLSSDAEWFYNISDKLENCRDVKYVDTLNLDKEECEMLIDRCCVKIKFFDFTSEEVNDPGLEECITYMENIEKKLNEILEVINSGKTI